MIDLTDPTGDVEMSGANVAYNLRPNKFVERQLFIELLAKTCRGSSDRYMYISLGGPQLEDQRQIHRQFGFTSLVSLEEDLVAYQRQLFNLRPSCITCLNQTTHDFVIDFDKFMEQFSDKTYIVWLDYTSPSKRLEQLNEFQILLGKMQSGDLLKITLNVNPDTLGASRKGESPDDLQARRLPYLRRQLDDYFPSFHVEPKQMTIEGLIPIFCDAVKTASLRAVQNTPRLDVNPLAIFYYNDGFLPMLKVTVYLTKRAYSDGFMKDLV